MRHPVSPPDKLSQRPSTRRTGALATVGLNLGVILLVLAAAAITPRDGKALVIVAPWSEPDRVARVIRDAGGAYVNGTGAPYAAIAWSDAPGFAGRLFRSGAVLVLDGGLARFCRSTPSK